MSAAAPAFSVIIATYNWSAALRLALQSVLAQTCGDFEVLVVGDACSDDSAQVVASFNDARLQWHNLPLNHGSQWAANNRGLMLARGRYVAYLGHDDLWWPAHLQNALATFEATGADVVAAGTLLYGPPASGIRAVTGFFANDRFTPRQFFPPSSMLHRRELQTRVGDWRPPEQAEVAVDVDFLNRCHAAGAAIAATGQFSVSKFNAAWRRDAYRTRDVSEQQAFLAGLRQHGDAFIVRELTQALHSAALDLFPRIEAPVTDRPKASLNTRANQEYKGSRQARSHAIPTLVAGRLRYAASDAYAGFEWHVLEQHPTLGAYRWSGPSRQSCIVLPERPDQPLAVTLLVVNRIHDEVMQGARMVVNGVVVPSQWQPGPDGALLWSGTVTPDAIPEADRDELRITIDLPHLWRPADLGPSEDRRWLGLAVGWVEVDHHPTESAPTAAP